MESKHFLASRTFQGLIVALLGMVLDKLDLPVNAPEIERGVSLLLELGGLAWAAYGRMKAARPVRFSGAPRAALMLLLVPALTLSACGGAKLTPAEAGRESAATLLEAYKAADAAYLELAAASEGERLPSEALAAIAQGLDRAKPIVVAYARLSALQCRVDACLGAKAQAALKGEPPPSFADCVPVERVRLAAESVRTALGVSVAIPEGESAVMEFLSTHLEGLHGLAVSALDAVAAHFGRAREA